MLTSWINTDCLRETGFRDIADGEVVKAEFYRIHVYKLHGCVLDDDKSIVEVSGDIDGSGYRLGIGSSINHICRTMLDDDFVDDEEKWTKEKNTAPPYLLIHYGPTSSHRCTKGLIQQIGSEITSYKCFGDAGAELSQLQQKILPRIVTALSVELSSKQCSFGLVTLGSVMYGTTPAGETVNDFTFTSSGGGVFAVTNYSKSDFSARLEGVVDAARSLHGKSARFFYLALDEEDELKRFLYFFLSIEVLAHSAFCADETNIDWGTFLSPPMRVSNAIENLARRQHKELRNLTDRFIWCAAWIWQSIDDEDILSFKRLKEIRDGIAHGRIERPAPGAVLAAEELARKLLHEQ